MDGHSAELVPRRLVFRWTCGDRAGAAAAQVGASAPVNATLNALVKAVERQWIT
ncbi:hypothetical protein [[Mycobacterium] vasticus]|uniref:Uncharacterized protein n=1 Tax=[Mycobacterium] vasticus TaxID=2875777 RepID=A0ABU5YR71_9MYCO|nr:hypothetical protein [Mycolicibacter sp. MYC017]MEB3067598.1 hypothetical protein [Mycolicibacter sp. MYC017]